MSSFSHTRQFHANVMRLIYSRDRATYNLLVHSGEHPDSVPNLFEFVSLQRLFAQAVIGNAGSNVHVRNLVGGLRWFDDVKEWIAAGGSPLLATKYETRNDGGIVPLLGYRNSVSNQTNLGSILRHLPSPLSIEQWERGTDREMVVSSLVRGLLKGTYRHSTIGKDVPASLFGHFGDPTIRAELCQYFRTMDFDRKDFMKESGMARMAFAFHMLGYPDLVQAIEQSPLYQRVFEYSRCAVQSLVVDAFQQGKERFDQTLDFIESFFDVSRLDPIIDEQLMQSMTHLPDGNWVEVIPTAIARFNLLKDSGRINQSIGWVQYVLPKVSTFPEIPDDQRSDFLSKIQGAYSSQKQIFVAMGSLGQGNVLSWLLKSIGKDAILAEYKNACAVSMKARMEEYGAIGHRIVDSNLLEFDHQHLHKHGMLYPILDALYDMYPTFWSKEVCESPGRNESIQHAALAQWVVKALETDPSDKQKAGLWLARLDQPSARKVLLKALPMDAEMLSELNHNERALRFTFEMGV